MSETAFGDVRACCNWPTYFPVYHECAAMGPCFAESGVPSRLPWLLRSPGQLAGNTVSNRGVVDGGQTRDQ
jgi:hypothetical protein